METKLCTDIYYVKSSPTDKLDDDLVNFLKESKIRLVCGEDPVNYIRDLLRNWKNQQVQHQQPPNSATGQPNDQSNGQSNNQPNSQPNSQPNNQPNNPSSVLSPDTSDDDQRLDANKFDNPLNRTIFVLREFNGDLFKQVNFHTKSILGLTALLYLCKQRAPIPMNNRPIHNYCMKDLYICFSNLTQRELAQKYLSLLRFMGGSSRKDMNAQKITHLISNKSGGNKYRVAITCGLPVMNLEWIDRAWEQRFDEDFKANDPQFIEEYRLLPFSQLYLAFVNFSEPDLKEMIELTEKNRGQVVAWDDRKCTHIIVDAIPGDPIELAVDLSTANKSVYVVYKEWFWASLEIAGRADEKISNHAYPLNRARVNTNHSVCTQMSETSRNFSYEILSPTLDFSTDSMLDTTLNESCTVTETVDYRSFSKRRKICLELLETEKNYLEILRVIVNIFYKPLDDKTPDEPVATTDKPFWIDHTERKIIFGNIPPILAIHEEIYSDLEKTVRNWSENCSIGEVFIKHSDALLKTYPAFCNFFENTRETLVRCDEKYPRFHAFLKKCQSRPECKRQSLAELLIRPVQRLPSISLLLNDLLRHTEKGLKDHELLKSAIGKVNEVLAHLNEDKRKTEGQIAMFDIINDIEECPASLLSANRHFLCKSDAKLILKNENKALPMKSYVLTLFLFNDVLEICKKRSIKRSQSLNQKSNKVASISGGKQSMKKSYKHIDTLPLEVIKLIYHFSLYDDCQNAITIVTNPVVFGTARTYRAYPFVLEDKEVKPDVFLANLCKQVSALCSSPNNIVKKGDLKEIIDIDFEYADQLADKLSKSNLSFAKITRAFSMKKASNSTNLATPANMSTSLYTPPRAPPMRSNSRKEQGNVYKESNVFKDTSMITPSPSNTRRISRVVSSIMNMGSPLMLSRRHISTTSLNEINDGLDGTFSCPTTPAPRKKTCIAKD